MIEELKQSINDNNIEKSLKLIENIGDEKNELALPSLLEILETTDNNIIRNQVALALSDIGNSSAVDLIIKMILSPKTQRSRGTLMYSLRNLEYTDHLKLFITLLSDRSFEVSREAFTLLESNCKNISNTYKTELLHLIQEELELVNDRLDLLNDAYELYLENDDENV